MQRLSEEMAPQNLRLRFFLGGRPSTGVLADDACVDAGLVTGRGR
ncbi:hypothetical protein [Streptomyces collinus]